MTPPHAMWRVSGLTRRAPTAPSNQRRRKCGQPSVSPSALESAPGRTGCHEASVTTNHAK